MLQPYIESATALPDYSAIKLIFLIRKRHSTIGDIPFFTELITAKWYTAYITIH